MVEKVLHTYGSLKDVKTGQPLFNKSAWKSAKNTLTLIKRGYLPEPLGIALYYQIGLDSENGGLPTYRRMYGTNMTEGGVHNKYALVCQYRVFHLNICIHLYSCLLDFILRHNLLVRPLI